MATILLLVGDSLSLGLLLLTLLAQLFLMRTLFFLSDALLLLTFPAKLLFSSVLMEKGSTPKLVENRLSGQLGLVFAA